MGNSGVAKGPIPLRGLGFDCVPKVSSHLFSQADFCKQLRTCAGNSGNSDSDSTRAKWHEGTAWLHLMPVSLKHASNDQVASWTRWAAKIMTITHKLGCLMLPY